MDLLSRALDLIFPPRCPGCGTRTEAVAFCRACEVRMPVIGSPRCPTCGLPFYGSGPDHRCARCTRRPPHFRQATACSAYHPGLPHPLVDALHRLKYGRDVSVAPILAAVLAARAPKADHDLILPVPLHRSRLQWRGFNQSLLIARALQPGAGGRLDRRTLARRRATPPQVGLGERERRKNVRKAFIVTSVDAVRTARILLVDDVMTTGATADECARVLRRSGAREVDVLVLLRALDAP
jgi:ComF family protein